MRASAPIANVWHALGFHRSSVLRGQFWRVFTPNLIHTINSGHGPPGLAHLLFNMSVLVVFGPKAEQRFGRLLFFAGYVVCGTFAYGWMVIAHPLQGPYSFAGGASGAIFGVVAALGVMLLRSSRTRSESAQIGRAHV